MYTYTQIGWSLQLKLKGGVLNFSRVNSSKGIANTSRLEQQGLQFRHEEVNSEFQRKKGKKSVVTTAAVAVVVELKATAF